MKYCIFHLAQVNEELLSVGKLERYKKTIQTASAGKLISDVVLQTLNKADRKQGMTGDAYLMEEQHYEEAMNTVFHNLMVRCIYYTMKPILVPGRGPGHPDPSIRGEGPSQKKFFSALRASVWSKNEGGGWRPPGPVPWIRH